MIYVSKDGKEGRWIDKAYQEALLVEYDVTQRKIEHSDEITWQRAGVLAIANLAALAYVATNFDRTPRDMLVGLGIWSAAIMMLWYLWDYRLQKEVTLKFARLHDIERMLGLRQHLIMNWADHPEQRPVEEPPVQGRRGPKGTRLAVVLLVLVMIAWLVAIVFKLLAASGIYQIV